MDNVATYEAFVDGELVERHNVPAEAAEPLLAYLERHGQRIPLHTLIRIFISHWNRGINLLTAPWPES